VPAATSVLRELAALRRERAEAAAGVLAEPRVVRERRVAKPAVRQQAARAVAPEAEEAEGVAARQPEVAEEVAARQPEVAEEIPEVAAVLPILVRACRAELLCSELLLDAPTLA
jgi:hypothetical protein